MHDRADIPHAVAMATWTAEAAHSIAELDQPGYLDIGYEHNT